MRVALQQRALHAGFSPGLMRQAAVVRLGGLRLVQFLRDEISRNPFLACGLPPPLPAPESGLRAHLLAQSRLTPMPPGRRRLVEALTDFVDERGRLALNPDDFADLAPGAPGRAELESALAVLRELDPPGVAARDLRECLLLQLARRIADEGESPPLLAARAIVGDPVRLGFFLRRRWDKLPRRRLAEAAAVLRRLNPEPGAAFAPAAPPLPPEVVFAKKRGWWKAEPGAALELSPRTLRRRAAPGQRWLRERAAELVAAVAARRRLTLKLAQWAADRQAAFLENGPEHLRPLPMSEAAAAMQCTVGMISHIARDKRCLAPRGGFPLKLLLSRPAAGGRSAAAVAQRLRRLVAAENPAAPLSDDALRALLRGEGLALARRTVAARRAAAGIPRASVRKHIPA